MGFILLKMFRITTAKPIPMKPNSYMNKIKNIQNEMLKNVDPAKISVQDPQEMTMKTQVSRVQPESAKGETRSEDRKLKKIEVTPEDKTYYDEEENIDKPKKKAKTGHEESRIVTSKSEEDELEQRISSIIESRIGRMGKDQKEPREPKDKARGEDRMPSIKEVEEATYAELKRIFDEKLSGIDEIVNYVRAQKNKPIANYPVQEPKVTEHHLEQDKPQTESQKATVRVVNTANEQPMEIEEKPLATEEKKQKRIKRSFYEITDSKWKEIKKEFPELKETDRPNIYSDGTENFIELKGKKIPLNYKAILKLTHERKAKENESKMEEEPEEEEPVPEAKPAIKEVRPVKESPAPFRDADKMKQEIKARLKDPVKLEKYKEFLKSQGKSE